MATEAVESLQPLRALGPGNRVEVRVEVEILLYGEVVVQAEALRHVGDVRLHCLGVRTHLDALHERLTA